MSPANVEVETVTLGEVNRNVSRLFDKVEELTKAVSAYPTWPDIKRIEQQQKDALAAVVKLAEEQHTAMESRIKELEGWQTWVGRSIIGALIGGAIALLFIFT